MFIPSAPPQPGKVHWDDFLYAMRRMRFTSQKLQGSAWRFERGETATDVKHSILFHEPHPRNKLSLFQARSIGRRLQRLYGWDGNMFTLQS
ncbi:hypothetical protein GGR54DRAFT_596535 [Hypoxylon sp. NC1633]|nr:hypothetical protein GGR54DRAFT_596535 [Hypoxylon sp. NC1633]